MKTPSSPGRRTVPRALTWSIRLVFWTIALIVIGMMSLNVFLFRAATDGDDCWDGPITAVADPLERTRQLGHCIADHGSFFQRLLMRRALKRLDSFPQAPARYVGLWRTQRSDAPDYAIELKSDGHFTAIELRNGALQRDSESTGRWSAANGRMDWFYPNVKDWPPDSNPIRDETADGFTLIERDGSRTYYTRLAALPPPATAPARASTAGR